MKTLEELKAMGMDEKAMEEVTGGRSGTFFNKKKYVELFAAAQGVGYCPFCKEPLDKQDGWGIDRHILNCRMCWPYLFSKSGYPIR